MTSSSGRQKPKGNGPVITLEEAEDPESGVDRENHSYHIIPNPNDVPEKQIVDDLVNTANNGIWFPGANDCHSVIKRTVKQHGLEWPGAPGGRVGSIPDIQGYKPGTKPQRSQPEFFFIDPCESEDYYKLPDIPTEPPKPTDPLIQIQEEG